VDTGVFRDFVCSGVPVFHGQFARRWCVVRIVAAVCDMGVANRNNNKSNSVGRPRVHPSAMEGRSLCGRGGAKEVRGKQEAKGGESTKRVFGAISTKGEKENTEKTEAVKTASRTCA
jgi:hypothetical protein